MYADYSYYTESYGGSAVSEEDFPRLAARASAYIDKLTFGRAAEHAADERLAQCCCDICNVLQQSSESGAVKQSESVGSWSVTYANTESQTEMALARSCCELWLPSEWLYKGVGRE